MSRPEVFRPQELAESRMSNYRLSLEYEPHDVLKGLVSEPQPTSSEFHSPRLFEQVSTQVNAYLGGSLPDHGVFELDLINVRRVIDPQTLEPGWWAYLYTNRARQMRSTPEDHYQDVISYLRKQQRAWDTDAQYFCLSIYKMIFREFSFPFTYQK